MISSQTEQKELEQMDKKAQLLAANKRAAQEILLAISLQLSRSVSTISQEVKDEH